MRVTMLAASVMALGACATVPPADIPSAESGGECTQEGTGEFIGKAVSQALGEEIQRRTGARVFQWVGPNQPVTMDYSPHRVRVHYDSARKIERIACG